MIELLRKSFGAAKPHYSVLSRVDERQYLFDYETLAISLITMIE